VAKNQRQLSSDPRRLQGFLRKLDFPKFGYKLYGNGIIIHRNPVFEQQALAAFEGLEFAFRIQEGCL